MAMYIMEEMPDIHGTGEQVLYPRFAMMEQVSTEDLIRQIASSSGFNVGDVEGVITQIGIEMAHQMAEGKSVKLDGIGTFSPSLALCKDKEREKAGEGETHRNARSIVVGNVNFRVDRKMMRRINGRCLLERAPWKSQRSSQKYTPEQRLALAVRYLEEHPFLTVYESCTISSAKKGEINFPAPTNELRQWAYTPGSGIGIDGRGTHRVYIKKT